MTLFICGAIAGVFLVNPIWAWVYLRALEKALADKQGEPQEGAP